MELGEKLRLARLEAGFSQRQLCGEAITRNMLSQIEHGTASPSMSTLRYLAGRLGKPVSFFLEEEGAVSPNCQTMAAARKALDAGDLSQAAEALKQYRSPDPACDREKELLDTLTRLGLGEKALREGRREYARQLLAEAVPSCCWCAPELERKRLLLLAEVTEDVSEICKKLPSLDGELLLRARGTRDGTQALGLLAAAENQDSPDLQLLRGKAYLSMGQYAPAMEALNLAQGAYPRETAPLLEQCCRELGDFKGAYEYAIAQRRWTGHEN